MRGTGGENHRNVSEYTYINPKELARQSLLWRSIFTHFSISIMLEFLKKNVAIDGNDAKTEKVKVSYTLDHDDLVEAATKDVFEVEFERLESLRNDIAVREQSLKAREARLDEYNEYIEQDKKNFEASVKNTINLAKAEVEIAKANARNEAYNEVKDAFNQVTLECSKAQGQVESLKGTVAFLEDQLEKANARAERAETALANAFSILASKMEQKVVVVNNESETITETIEVVEADEKKSKK